MALVSGGGGSTPFNGGTITTPEVIDVGALATAGGLTIQGTSGANVNRLVVDFLHTLLTLTGDGVLSVTSDDAMGVSIGGTSDSGAGVTISNSPTAYFVALSAGSTVAAVQAASPSGVVAALYADRGVVTALHAAPADGLLAAGDCALWFDQTNGAGNTKLMVKGKSADGTVKTASVVLA